MVDNEEIKYLYELLDGVDFDKYDFRLKWTEDKEVIGVMNNTGDKSLSDLYKNETFYRTLLNINEKVQYSLKRAIEYAYSEEVMEDFIIFGKSTEKANLAFYYIENAIFRTSTLWDILAHLYNIHCDIGKGVRDIYYKQFFKNEFDDASLNINQNVENIINYINEDNDTTTTEGFWKGNHQYIKEYRNQMIHRNVPDEHSFSNLGMNFKTHPTFLLKRLIEDYHEAMRFINEILELISDDIK